MTIKRFKRIDARSAGALLLSLLLTLIVGIGAVAAADPVPAFIGLGGTNGQLDVNVTVNWHVDGTDTVTVAVSGPGLNHASTVAAPADPAFSRSFAVPGGLYTVTITERHIATDGTISLFGPTSQSIDIPAPKPAAPAPTSPPVAPAPPPPAATAPPQPPAQSPAPQPQPPTEPVPPLVGGGSAVPDTGNAPNRTVNCDSFGSREEAQYFFMSNNPTADPYGLDGNDDGLACTDAAYGATETSNGQPSASANERALSGLFDDNDDNARSAALRLRGPQSIDLLVDDIAVNQVETVAVSIKRGPVAIAYSDEGPAASFAIDSSADSVRGDINQGNSIVPIVVVAAAGVLMLLGLLFALRRRSDSSPA